MNEDSGFTKNYFYFLINYNFYSVTLFLFYRNLIIFFSKFPVNLFNKSGQLFINPCRIL